MIERDLETGKQTFHPLPVTREFLDLPPIGGRGLSAADLDAAIAAAVARASGGIDGKVVRLVARDVPRHIACELDHKMLREFQRRALHFHLDMRRPEVMRTFASGGNAASGSARVRNTDAGRRRRGNADPEWKAVVLWGPLRRSEDLEHLLEWSDATRAVSVAHAVATFLDR